MPQAGNAAVHAGLLAHDLGGSAIDAAMTTALTQICLAGGAWVSYAGFTQIVGRIHKLTSPLIVTRNGKPVLSIG